MKFKLTIQYPAETIAISQVINIYDKLDPHMKKFQLADLLRDKEYNGSWENAEVDMKAISVDFPSIVFILNIFDVELETMGLILYFKNGKYYSKDLIITSPEFDEVNLQ